MTTCPHCMGAGCLHCREAQLERTRLRRQRARLTDEERAAFGLVVHSLVPRHDHPKPRTRAPRPACRMQTVLPANFALPTLPARSTVPE